MARRVTIDDRTIEQIMSSSNDELSVMIRNVGAELIEVLKYIDKIENEKSSSKRVDEDQGFANSLKIYLIIRLVTTLETTCRKAFILLIDEFDKVFDSTIETSFNNLKTINKEQTITLGKIVASSLNFQKFESSDKELDVFKIFTKVLDVDVFAKLVDEDSKIPLMRPVIEDLVNERHRLVHEISFTDWDIQKIKLAFFDVFSFLKSLGNVIKKNR